MPAHARLAIVVLGLLAATVTGAPVGQADAPGAAEQLRLVAGSSETGWISLTLQGRPDGPVVIHERAGGRDRVVARMTLNGGTSTLGRAVAWRCDRRRRAFTATRTTPGSAARSEAATISTPSCTKRLQLIVAPARLRPGRSATVRVADAWRRGGLSGRVCARLAASVQQCRTLRLRAGQIRVRTRVPLTRAGTWTVTLHAASAPADVRRRVEVGPRARYRVLVTGDSMVYGIIDVLGRSVRKTGGTLIGDPHPATGITKPTLLDWPVHARGSARGQRPDATVAFLGAAGDAFPLPTSGGVTAECCATAWVSEYARRVSAMIHSYLRKGSGLVYWVLLPAPRDPRRVESNHAINAAIRQAAAAYPDGVRVVDIGPAISPADVYRSTAIFHGRRVVIREPDGIHLMGVGVHIATQVIVRAMRRDGVATS